MTPEFSRPQRLDQIGAGESRVSVKADDAERAALSRRFDLHAIDVLTADYALRRDAAGVIATGTLHSSVAQRCSVTGDPVAATLDQPFTIRFVPEQPVEADEVELDSADCDIVFYSGSAIDLGEAAAETLALALDPFPRSPQAARAARDAGVIGEDEVKPLGVFAGLKDLLKGD